ncbi:MAG: signal peptidase II [Clostridia bacterium]|nr:signal peptidase II [Clostridia bacterium]
MSIFILIIDVITKFLAEGKLQQMATLPVWQGVFHFTYVENRGIAFGMFGGGRIVFILLTVLVLVLLAVFYRKTNHKTKWLCYGLSLIFGGAIGNLLDRIFRGYVVDFLDFRLIDFPVFNVADIAVCIGAVLLVIHFFKSEEIRKDEPVG